MGINGIYANLRKEIYSTSAERVKGRSEYNNAKESTRPLKIKLIYTARAQDGPQEMERN